MKVELYSQDELKALEAHIHPEVVTMCASLIPSDMNEDHYKGMHLAFHLMTLALSGNKNDELQAKALNHIVMGFLVASSKCLSE